ncbi:hypothetical protein BDQ17DRAFT_1363550 [Cyathus striatus]|nr:hypothetical protein BDQ17DRAFT_1363550 [Cyathus striatus]
MCKQQINTRQFKSYTTKVQMVYLVYLYQYSGLEFMFSFFFGTSNKSIQHDSSCIIPSSVGVLGTTVVLVPVQRVRFPC